MIHIKGSRAKAWPEKADCFFDYALYEIAEFCASTVLGDFSILTKKLNEHSYDYGLEGAWGASPIKVGYKDAWKELIKERTFEGMIFMGDRKGGPADGLIFPFLPKRTKVLNGYKYKFYVSPYFRNGNTGNMCRWATIIKERV